MSRVWWLGCAPFVLAACGGGSDPGSQDRPAAISAEVAKAVDKAVNVDKKALASENNVANSDRRIIYKAEVALIVDDFEATEREIPNLVKQHGGYLADLTVNRTQGEYRMGHWVARIPADRFDAFLDSLDGLGVTESRRQTADDVTEEFVDLESRITNKRRLEERIVKLLEGRGGKIEEIIRVEHELARVRESIEKMQGRKRYLADRTAMSTVTIKAREERDYVPEKVPTFSEEISSTWTGSLSAMQKLGQTLLIIAVAAAPWIVLLAPIVWLSLRWWIKTHRPANPVFPPTG